MPWHKFSCSYTSGDAIEMFHKNFDIDESDEKDSRKMFKRVRMTSQVIRIYMILIMLAVCKIMTVLVKAHLLGNTQSVTEKNGFRHCAQEQCAPIL